MFHFSEKITVLSEQAVADAAEVFRAIDATAQHNTGRVLAAFQRFRVSDGCFAGTTGYGYNDTGRETLDRIYADVMGTPSALVRTGFVNGTHAITAALFAALRPGQTLLSVTGAPYDTLLGVIGITGEYRGSLKEIGVSYSQLELCGDVSDDQGCKAHHIIKNNNTCDGMKNKAHDGSNAGGADLKVIADAVRKNNNIGAVFIQRSRGYSSRRALTVSEIHEICETVHTINPDVVVVVDNCYGEFTETTEPGHAGADLIAGSLIKNPGGGIAPAGGYVTGREDLVEAAAYRLTSPGIGAECGATLGLSRLLYQGLFMAPHTVAQAMKTAVFSARLFELLGYKTLPKYNEPRSDIIQMIGLGSPELLESFCKGIQAGAPVDSYVTPIAWDMPGYDHKVIMAAGAFIQGASIELSADGPMREPYNVYLQGGLTFESGKLGVMLAAEHISR